MTDQRPPAIATDKVVCALRMLPRHSEKKFPQRDPSGGSYGPAEPRGHPYRSMAEINSGTNAIYAGPGAGARGQNGGAPGVAEWGPPRDGGNGRDERRGGR